MTEGGGTSGRDDRTLLYTGGVKPTVPAGVTCGPATASTMPGQLAILTAVNILARSHPEIVLAVSDTYLAVPCPTGGATLIDACGRLALAANPDVVITFVDIIPDHILTLGIGADSGRASIYAGGSRWTARTSREPEEITDEPTSMLGVALAVTLATGFIFRTALGWPAVADRAVSLWTFLETVEPTGPAECGSVDLGTVWVVGAGAVGSCLAWWLSFLGVTGTWHIIDGDVVDVTNLNRSLGLFAAHAGLTGHEPVGKAVAAADLIPGAVAEQVWWDEWVATDPPSPDVLIPVANDRGIRPAVAAYGHPATIHATTSPNWTAKLHRHLPGQDGCIACRLPENAPVFGCATGSGEATEGEPRKDAALPFLSSAAGLLLLSGLLHIQHGQWPTHTRNHWRLFFDESGTALHSSRWCCSQGCEATPAPTIRRAIHGATRWCHLDLQSGDR
jgi:ThiF family